MSVKSFVPQLQGVSNIIDLALSSHLEQVPTIVFASSVSDLQSGCVKSFDLCGTLTLHAPRLLRRWCRACKNLPRSKECDRHGIWRVQVGGVAGFVKGT